MEGNKVKKKASTLRNSGNDSYRLSLPFVIFNIVAFSLLYVAYLEGWVMLVFENDKTNISIVIVVWFLVLLLLSTNEIWKVDKELKEVNEINKKILSSRFESKSLVGQYLSDAKKVDANGRTNLITGLKTKLGNRVNLIRFGVEVSVLLGLLGTITGIIIAFQGVDFESIGGVEDILPMLSVLSDGFSTAFFTTLVGTMFGLWLMLSQVILQKGLSELIDSLIRQGETHGR